MSLVLAPADVVVIGLILVAIVLSLASVWRQGEKEKRKSAEARVSHLEDQVKRRHREKEAHRGALKAIVCEALELPEHSMDDEWPDAYVDQLTAVVEEHLEED